MSFLIEKLQIDENTPEGRALKAIVRRDHVTPEEAVRKALRTLARPTPAEEMIGAFSSPEDAALLDEAMEIARQARKIDEERLYKFAEK
jgi:hypothetical protein